MIKTSKNLRGLNIKKVDLFYIINALILGLWALTIIYPFYNSFLASIVTQKEYVRNPFMLIPKNITFEAYAYIFNSSRVLSGYKNTILLLVLGLPYNMLITTCLAYALSRDSFPGKKFFSAVVIFTMYFGGGLIPFYLLIKNLGLNNSLAAIILSYGANTFYVILMRNYFASLPKELEESAKVDGANDIFILFNVAIPLSKPIFVTVLLFFAVDRWNEWFNSMLFLRDSSNWPLQVVLRSIVVTSIDDISSRDISLRKNLFSDGVKMAAVLVTMAPVMLVYPFLQKYFMKGILIGAVKG